MEILVSWKMDFSGMTTELISSSDPYLLLCSNSNRTGQGCHYSHLCFSPIKLIWPRPLSCCLCNNLKPTTSSTRKLEMRTIHPLDEIFTHRHGFAVCLELLCFSILWGWFTGRLGLLRANTSFDRKGRVYGEITQKVRSAHKLILTKLPESWL